jgi:mono/diheme cytochrome c family protein
MKYTLTATLLLLSCTGLTWAGAAEGKEIYTGKCAACHGADGEAKPAMAKMFPSMPAKLGAAKVFAKSDDELKAVILKGQGKMKPVSGVTEKQAADVVAFVRTLK